MLISWRVTTDPSRWNDPPSSTYQPFGQEEVQRLSAKVQEALEEAKHHLGWDAWKNLVNDGTKLPILKWLQ